MNKELALLQDNAISLLKKLIATPSFSKEEQNTADLIERFLEQEGVRTKTHMNNIWAQNRQPLTWDTRVMTSSSNDASMPPAWAAWLRVRRAS